MRVRILIVSNASAKSWCGSSENEGEGVAYVVAKGLRWQHILSARQSLLAELRNEFNLQVSAPMHRSARPNSALWPSQLLPLATRTLFAPPSGWKGKFFIPISTHSWRLSKDRACSWSPTVDVLTTLVSCNSCSCQRERCEANRSPLALADQEVDSSTKCGKRFDPHGQEMQDAQHSFRPGP